MREELIHTVKYVLGTVLLTMLAVGCRKEDVSSISETETASAVSYVSLHFAFPQGASTRNNPTGGEDGDGDEAGQNYEKSVSNVTLFFYEGTQGDNGVNRTDDIQFAAVKYVEGITSLTVGPIEIEGLKAKQPYHVLAVANAGDLSDEITTLNKLKNYAVQDVYTVTADGGYTDFVMASASDESQMLEIKEGNSKTNPATTTIDLERLAARVDYKTDSQYNLTDDPQISATITYATLVNLYNQSTYLLKRVADDANGANLSYLGDEIIGNGDETTGNYVIDPNTASKTLPATNASGWYDRYYPNLTDNDDWVNWLIEGDVVTNPENDADTWLRLGYVKENTSSVVAQGACYSTGVVFEAEYDLGEGFTKGETFFRVNKSTLYSTLEDAMKAHDPVFDEKDNTFTNYADFQKYMNSLIANDPAGYKAYLRQASESDYTQYTWSNYKSQVLGYNAEGKPTATTREVLHDRTGNATETFLNGCGYYIYWIRHNGGSSVDDFDESRPMAYAIVRNNIYKLKVESISKIGSDIPTREAMYIIIDDSWDGVHELEPTNPN